MQQFALTVLTKSSFASKEPKKLTDQDAKLQAGEIREGSKQGKKGQGKMGRAQDKA